MKLRRDEQTVQRKPENRNTSLLFTKETRHNG